MNKPDARVHNFNPRSPHGERPVSAFLSGRNRDFNPRSPHGERHLTFSVYVTEDMHFNPRSPHGERRYMDSDITLYLHFNPRSPHGERLKVSEGNECPAHISIHAPRTGSD